ncbi:MAG: type II toxin-antitoxin system death-on-curing family toxin [Candidatus Omnitrophica bacterium]|nr:type II toxin-antitoxin system death-on-curing family toxin [Candidatus Omnitrophota bacterium]
MKDPLFLNLAEIIQIHSNQIQLYGGSEGVRDMHLLQSALAQPEASFGGVWLHQDLYEMASAYAFHICQNHPFIDGNKRSALAVALVFLEINGISLRDPKGYLLDGVLKLASGQMNKKEFSKILRKLPKG